MIALTGTFDASECNFYRRKSTIRNDTEPAWSLIKAKSELDF